MNSKVEDSLKADEIDITGDYSSLWWELVVKRIYGQLIALS